MSGEVNPGSPVMEIESIDLDKLTAVILIRKDGQELREQMTVPVDSSGNILFDELANQIAVCMEKYGV